MNFVIIILAVLLSGAVVGIALLWRKLVAERIALARVESELEAGQKALARTEDEILQLKANIEALQDEAIAQREESTEYQKKIADLNARREADIEAHNEARRKLNETFESLSSKVLKSSSEQFLKLANENFNTKQKESQAELDKRKQAVENLVKPIGETLKTYQTKIDDIEKSRKESYGSIREMLTNFGKDQKNLRDETNNLVSALRRPDVRGRWGEIQLHRVAELAGMIDHCDFEEQLHVRTSEGPNQRPDMVVMLPNDRTIVIDAKTSLKAYLNAIEAEDDKERKKFLITHTTQIEERIKELAKKGYAAQFDHSPDFVILFIPGEAFLQAAVQQKPDLFEYALEKGIVIAAPTTLISLLRVIALGWREQQMTENAQQIALAGKELHSRIATAFVNFDKLRKSLQKTVENFNSTVGSFNSQFLPQAKRLEELGSGSAKQLAAETETIDITPRAVPLLSDEE